MGAEVEQAAAGTSRSAVSRKFVAATESALAELLAADLSALDLVAFMVDGVRELIVGLRERRLDVTRPILTVIDGVDGAASGDHGCVRQACDPEMPTNGCAPRIMPKVPWPPTPSWRPWPTSSITTHPSAAGLREGLDETLTVL